MGCGPLTRGVETLVFGIQIIMCMLQVRVFFGGVCSSLASIDRYHGVKYSTIGFTDNHSITVAIFDRVRQNRYEGRC